VPASETGRRRQLADWLADPNNPLTPRVMVNRIWLITLAKASCVLNDFGARGQPPSSGAVGLSGVSFHRRRLFHQGDAQATHASQAYQMSTADNAAAALNDPDNRLLWKFNRRRLDAEEIRDAMLAVSGALDRTPGGAHPFKPEWEWRYTQHKPFVDDFESNRRSVYLLYQRIRLQPILGLFDGADPNAATGRGLSAPPRSRRCS
jgi:hypothetical protein